MNILIVLTSHDQLGDTGQKTGFWLEELAAPYYAFKAAGSTLTLASPQGGQPPVDPKSDAEDGQTEDMRRFKADAEAMAALATTRKLSEVAARDFDAIFYPGGHGPLWDLTVDTDSIRLIEDFWSAGKPVSAVCHGPTVLLHPKDAGGEPIVKGRKVTGFTNAEEEAVNLTEVVPHLVEDELKARGGVFENVANWQSHVAVDGRLVTGQNPASSKAAADAVVDLLRA